MIKRPNEDYNGYILELSTDEYCFILHALGYYLESTSKSISFYEDFIKRHNDSVNEKFQAEEQLSYFLNRKKIIEGIINC